MRLVRLGLGIVNAYLVQAHGGDVLVDAGLPGLGWRLLQLLEKHGSSVETLKLIIITHAHFDHVGALNAIRERTGAPVLVHQLDAPVLRSGEISLPAGQTMLARGLMAMGAATTGRFRLRGCEPDILVEDEFDLGAFGVAGRLIHTPGHTLGSISLLLDSGDAVVGDLCQFGFGFGLGMGPIIPPLADVPRALAPSYRRVLAAGPLRIHPGHGVPFETKHLEATLDRIEGRP